MGKQIALVGNAKSLFSKHQGSEIDSKEVVCRINAGCEIIDSEHQGIRTDLGFLSPPNIFKSICESNPSFTIIHATSLQREEPYNIGFECIPKELNDEMYLKLKVRRPSTGIFVLNYLLSFKPSKIYCFGFDFKKTPNAFDNNTKKSPHNFDLEEAYFKKLEEDGLIDLL